MELSAVASEKIASLLATNGILSQDRLLKFLFNVHKIKKKLFQNFLRKTMSKKKILLKLFQEILQSK